MAAGSPPLVGAQMVSVNDKEVLGMTLEEVMDVMRDASAEAPGDTHTHTHTHSCTYACMRARNMLVSQKKLKMQSGDGQEGAERLCYFWVLMCVCVCAVKVKLFHGSASSLYGGWEQEAKILLPFYGVHPSISAISRYLISLDL